jgi:hypothetical protein
MLKVLLPVDGSKSATRASKKLVETPWRGTKIVLKSICSRCTCQYLGSRTWA